ncbi:MAG TPA: hypothetical protein VEY30_04275, partial [Myxococcaceae bacterium]|nr:hypothetical protein [Myxococcaceae bacterium]
VLALSWDEAKAALESLQTRTARLEGEKRTLEEAQQPVDWQNRANALSAAVAELSEKGEPLAARERTLGAEAERVVSELRALPPTELSPRDASAWQRAQAVYLGVRGEVGATELVRSYREGQVPGEQDGWAEVALAEYALHADAPAAALSEATEGLKVLKVRDSEFLRAQVLAGRLALKAGNSKEAQTALEAVVTLNPRHQFAQELLTVAQEAVAPAEPRPDPTRE